MSIWMVLGPMMMVRLTGRMSVMMTLVAVSAPRFSKSGRLYNPDYVSLKNQVTPIISGNQVIWPLGSLVGGASGQIDLTVRVTDTASAGEALTNVIRHAQASRVYVELRNHGDALELSVRDNGIGFDVDAAWERAAHGASLGLIGMRERIQLVGGRLALESVPGYGTDVRARLPLGSFSSPGEGEQAGDPV